MNSQSSIDFINQKMENQYRAVPAPRSRLQLGKLDSAEEIKNSFISSYNITHKPNNPSPYIRKTTLQNSSSIVLDVPSNATDFRSEAMVK